MTSFFGSIGMIRHPDQMEKLWLSIWDDRDQHYDFVFAEKIESDSFRECLDREIAWVLPLERKRDYLISSMARLHLEIALQLSSNSQPTSHVLELFVVDLYGKRALQAIDNNSSVRWLTTPEILSGITKGGQPISPRLVSLLRRADVLPPQMS